MKYIDKVLKEGKCIKGKYVVLYFLREDKSSFDVVVTRKIRKKVIKNKIKRRIKEIYRKNKFLFDSFKMHIVVMVLKPAELEGTYAVLEEELKKLIKKI